MCVALRSFVLISLKSSLIRSIPRLVALPSPPLQTLAHLPRPGGARSRGPLIQINRRRARSLTPPCPCDALCKSSHWRMEKNVWTWNCKVFEAGVQSWSAGKMSNCFNKRFIYFLKLMLGVCFEVIYKPLSSELEKMIWWHVSKYLLRQTSYKIVLLIYMYLLYFLTE